MDFKVRLENLRKAFRPKGIDFFIIDDSLSIFYLTGFSISSGRLCLSKAGHKLFVDGRYIESIQGKGVNVALFNEDNFLDFFNEDATHLTIAFDSSKTTFAAYQRLFDSIKKIEKRVYKKCEFKLIGIDNLLKDLRAVKDLEEIEKMKQAAALNWRGMKYIRSLLKEGVQEKDIALEYEIFCLKNGGEKLSFEPIIAFGEHSSMPHYETGEGRLKKDDVALMDIGITLNNYNSDLTRTFLIGEVDPLLRKFYDVAREAHKEVLTICKPGSKIGDLDEAAREVIARSWYNKYSLHSTGHGVGLEIHEFPRLKWDGDDRDAILRAGMFITVEPGLYKSGLGGIRYEDTILITETGYENLYTEEII